MSFTWIPYYKEFAQRLTQFQKDRKRLLNLQRICSKIDAISKR